METEVATEDHLSSPVPPLLFDFRCNTRRDPKNSPPRVDPGLPHLTGIAHNIRKGRATTQIFSHISGGADFVMLGEVNKELNLPLKLSTRPRAPKIFHNLGEGGTNGVALVVGPRLAAFTSPLPPSRSERAAGGLPRLPAPLGSFHVGFRLLPPPPQ